jgi:starch synthase
MEFKNMRVVCLSWWFFDYTIQLANSLARKGVVVMLMLPKDMPKDYISLIDPRTNIFFFNRTGRLYYPTNILAVFEILKGISSFQPDIIHIQGGQPWFCLFLPILKRRYRLVTTFHDIKLHLGEESLIMRFTMHCTRKYSDKIFVHGRKLKETMMNEYGLLGRNIHVIPLGEHEIAPFKKYERGDLKEDDNLILFFGRIRKYKGLEYLIKAEPLIIKEIPDLKIVIAGEGEFMEYENIKDKSNFIVYNHYITYKKGAELFQKSALIVLPYVDASQSGVVITAYGFKKPVIVTNVGSIPEIVDHEKTGLIVSPRNAEELARAIIKLLKDKKLRRTMGENAYKKLEAEMSWEQIAERIIKVYKECI